MKLNIRAAAITSALVWSSSVLIVGVANIAEPRYGRRFLQLAASVYPGYKARPTLSQVAVGTAYAAVDGAVGGALCAWLYNRFDSICETPEAAGESDRGERMRTAV